jgi:hypothetical protein
VRVLVLVTVLGRRRSKASPVVAATHAAAWYLLDAQDVATCVAAHDCLAAEDSGVRVVPLTLGIAQDLARVR